MAMVDWDKQLKKSDVEPTYTDEEILEICKKNLIKYADVFRRLEELDNGGQTFD
ncbi:MAG: hypothetical protein FWG64_14140 [Firmicutes bacterium]|nr:hypothetical protein [Bacillota bacterium]